MRFCVYSMLGYALLCAFSSFAIILIGMNERAVCLALFAFFVSYDCYLALSYEAMGFSVVCDCGIS